jgi:hypothetical protein
MGKYYTKRNINKTNKQTNYKKKKRLVEKLKLKINNHLIKNHLIKNHLIKRKNNKIKKK